MKFKFKHGRKKLNIDVRQVSKFSTGLMFKTNQTRPLLFEFEKPSDFKITSLFVFFPFVAVWFDKDNKVIEARKIKPFTLSIEPEKKFLKLLEIPVNDRNRKIIKTLLKN